MRCRIRPTRVRSISKNEVTWAAERRAATMCSLVSARIFDIGSTRSPGQASGTGPCSSAPTGAYIERLGAACAPDARLCPRHPALHRGGLALLDGDLGPHPSPRGRNLGIHLVGGNLEEGFVAL